MENLLEEQHNGYTGLEAALENAYLVGSVVVDEILTNWSTYENRTAGRETPIR